MTICKRMHFQVASQH